MQQAIERTSDNFVVAIVIGKQTLIRVSPAQVLQQLKGYEVQSPDFPEEVMKWIELNQISSEKLRKN